MWLWKQLKLLFNLLSNKAYQSFLADMAISKLFAGTTAPDTWLRHAQGIATLMEQRGPAAHAQGNDAAILFSFRGILVRHPLPIYPLQFCLSLVL